MIKVFYYKDGTFTYPTQPNGINLCLGFFDGLHQGHLSLIGQALKDGHPTGVLTFDGNLKFLTDKREEAGLLTTVEDREQILDSLGVDYLFVVPFTSDIMNMSSQDFMEKILKPLRPSCLYVGADFSFGQGGKGTPQVLMEDFKVKVVSFLTTDRGLKISASYISALVRKGKVKEAAKWLGKNYSLSGQVVHGLGNGGAKLGYPTANIRPDKDYIVPMNGVYATYTVMEGKEFLSMTDIGFHPTIDKLMAVSIESNLFDFAGDAYSERVRLIFLDRIRDEKKFSSIEELIKQLAKDKEKILKQYGNDRKNESN